METPWLNIYIDESGTNELDSSKSGVSHLFFCIAIILKNSDIRHISNELHSISNKYCSGAEIKSNRIGTNHKQRLKYLNRITKLPFSYYALIVNKEKLPKESPFQYKQTFYKFMHSKLYAKLQQSGCNLKIFPDTIGDENFMNSFKSYLEGKGLFTNLFCEFEHSFIKSHENPIIQLADLVAGTLTYCFDQDKNCEYSEQFRNILKTKEVGINVWPSYQEKLPNKPTKSEEELNNYLTILTKNKARSFIKDNINSNNSDKKMQAIVLEKLLFSREFESKENQSIYADALIKLLKSEGFDMSKHSLSSKVIGKIREAGIILAGNNDGYRLAYTKNDINEYLIHNKNIIEPMLYRLNIARTTINQGTINEYNIFQSDEFKLLKQIVDCFSEVKIKQNTTKN